jgi:hypothetical protein
MEAREFIFVRVVRLYPLYFLGLMLGLGAAFVNPFLIQRTAIPIGLVLSRADLWVRKAFIRWAKQRRWADFPNRDPSRTSAIRHQER